MKKIPLIACVLLLGFLIASCSDDVRRGLDLEIPIDNGIVWNYDIYQYDRDAIQRIGTVRSENFGIGPFQQRDNVLRVRRTIRIDSLAATQDSIRFSSIYFDLSQNLEITAYLDDFFRAFDGMIDPAHLDTLTTGAQQAGRERFTRFRNQQPGWNLFRRFDAGTVATYTILEPDEFELDFRYRGHRLTGFARVGVYGVYDGSGNITIPWRENVFTHRVRTLAFFDFHLTKDDSVSIAPFRETLEMVSWYHPDGGLIQQDRKPFEITVPTIPSRGPGIVYRGHRWVLRDLQGLDI